MTQEALEQYLMSAGDDVTDEDIYSQYQLNTTSEDAQIPDPIPDREVPYNYVVWNIMATDLMEVPFNKRRKLLILPNGK